MATLEVKHMLCENLTEEQLDRIAKLLDSVCNKECMGHLCPVKHESIHLLDCSMCPFYSIYNALNPMED